MAVALFLDASVLDLIARHVTGGEPPPPEYEWAVDDLYFLFERFGPQLRLRVAEPLAPAHRDALAAVAARYGCTWDVLPAAAGLLPAVAGSLPPADQGADPPAGQEPGHPPAGLVQDLEAAGALPAQARHLAACAAAQVRYALYATQPDPDYRDRVHRLCGVYVVSPMDCLSHLHAVAMGRGRL